MTAFSPCPGWFLPFRARWRLALARLSPYRWIRLPGTAVVQVLRGTPVLNGGVQELLRAAHARRRCDPGLITLIGALVIYESAYLAEIIRSAFSLCRRTDGGSTLRWASAIGER